ncbi:MULTISPECIES: family 1 glycosylhydrolase [Spirosoma]|uniref:Family 1 glycosylhydrolase n=1 Tax=Spirosoma liriopis TaxID=2937440 RepID=A0ABT0HIG9_9BACT|nr:MULTISPECIES: family 1 glycosylhydrolase [Spirosoma]MCK8491949.1 family 1 glycosylhydrolase [Spirosoma liriopis]UHG91270.1 family 1 glycosylhydrolase [Spirosoma oryzicola]
MSQGSFLGIIKKKFGDGNYDGDQFGGAGGHDGSGLPVDNPSNFMFATGIECSYPTIEHGKVRRDQLRECGHYDRWKEDLGLVKEMGLKVLRYGLPYYSIHLGPGKYDWSFADVVMAEMKKLGITPILDLLHFGLPDWIGNFQNPELPIHFAEYAEAVAKRYPWVRYYTPVNEIYVTARISGKDGIWNEQLKTDKGFVTALKHCAAASIMANQQIAKHRNDVVIVQSESAEYTHELCATPSPQTDLENELRFLSLDLLYANPPSATVAMYMMDNGLTRKEYDWFMAGKPPGYQIMGNDYYGRNERIKLPDGSIKTSMDVLGWYEITRDYYERYRMPVMHTETNVFEADQAPIWLYKQWVGIMRMRRDGVPVLGFTWYSLIDQIDWDIQLAAVKNNVNACGLYDLDRKPRPVAEAYKNLLKEFGQITIVPYGEMLEMTDQPARLKTQV